MISSGGEIGCKVKKSFQYRNNPHEKYRDHVDFFFTGTPFMADGDGNGLSVCCAE